MKNTKIYSGLCLLGVAGLLSKTYGADAPAVAAGEGAWQKPVWLTDLSLGVKESYDDNVFVSGVTPNNLPPYVTPPGSVAAPKTDWAISRSSAA